MPNFCLRQTNPHGNADKLKSFRRPNIFSHWQDHDFGTKVKPRAVTQSVFASAFCEAQTALPTWKNDTRCRRYQRRDAKTIRLARVF